MKLKMLACSVIIVCSSTAIAKNNLITHYKNARGSTLTIQVDENNNLTGTFTTAVATKQCPQTVGVEQSIIGFMVNNALTISVAYPDCGSVLTFIGNVDNKNGYIDVTSILAQQSNQILDNGNGVQLITHDTFKRV